jgi:WD40 repeat protein
VIASAGADGTIRVWHWQTENESVVLGQHNEGMNSVAFSPDGTKVVSDGADNTVRVWECAICRLITDEDLLKMVASRITRELTPDERMTFLH